MLGSNSCCGASGAQNPMPAEAAEKERQEWQQEMGGSR